MICFNTNPNLLRCSQKNETVSTFAFGRSSKMRLLFLRIILCALLLRLAVSAGDDEFIFNGFSGANLVLHGIACIGGDGLLRLTNATRQTEGQAFYPKPLRFKPSSSSSARSFSTTFVFAIVPQYPTISSYGFTFCLSPTKKLDGGAANFLGLFNSANIGLPSNHIAAVEFDTIQTPAYNDIDDNHIGIDLNNLTSFNASSAGYFADNGQFQNLSLISGVPMQVWIDYDGNELQLNVTLAPFKMLKPGRPLLSSRINLSDITLENMFVGFTSSEGNVLTNHYILGWSFKMDSNAPALDLPSLPSLPETNQKNKSKILVVWLPISALLLLAAALITGYIALIKLKYAELLEEWEQEYGPYRFAYKDLFRATDGFNDKWFIGYGGFGSVYRGFLRESKVEVAIKKVSHESRQGMREFVAEVVSLGRLRHRNLVRLLGYCRRKGELLLVYDFMPNGSLDKYLFSRTRPCLDWNQRFRIIRNIASGLLYLHEDWVKVVIHRDIKASNVLLDGDFNGRLGDFGLSRLYDHGTDPQTTRVVGTMGYLAPELTTTGKATTRTDVYAFGVFLLEVACGRRPMVPTVDADDLILVDWVLENWQKGDILATGDSRLCGQYVVEEMELVLKLGLLCCHPFPSERPNMRQVMQFLDGNISLPELPPTSLSVDDSALPEANLFECCVISLPPSADISSILSGGR